MIMGMIGAIPLCGEANSAIPMVAAVSLEQAARMVQENAGGRVLGAETRNVRGRLVHVIKVLTADGRRVKHIQVDAQSGRIGATQ